MNLQKHWAFYESFPLKFSPIYILDPRLLVSILTFRVLKCQFFNKICIFPLWQVQNWNITYQLFPKKYTYALLKSAPCKKFGDFCKVVENTSLKWSHNSSLRYKRQKSPKIKTKTKQNITKQNSKFLPVNI